jgi:hypothetical protein
MTIEVYIPIEPFVIAEASETWFEAALLFMRGPVTIVADRSLPLTVEDGKTRSLTTFANPDSAIIDTVAKIEIKESGQPTQIIAVDSSNPYYICQTELNDRRIAVDKIVRYHPANGRT